MGDFSRKSAHPFLFDDVLGAHNGTLDAMNKQRLERGTDFKTDSEALFNNIQVHGIEDTISRIEATEAYALTWYDRRDNSLNFLRNKHRPLWYVSAKNKKTIFWASEYEILVASCIREGIEIEEKAHLLPEDSHHKWIIPTLESEVLPVPLRATYKNKVWTYSGTGGTSRANYLNYGNGGVWDGDGYTFDDCAIPETSTNFPTHTNIQTKLANGTTIITPTKIMNGQDVFRQNRYDNKKKSEGNMDKMPIIFKNNDLVVHLNKEKREFVTFRWGVQTHDWNTFINSVPPLDIPFTILDIESRHQFQHTGKKDKKKVFYKAFQGKLLDMDDFSTVMKKGCVQCDRRPEWGNEVTFLDKELNFLCEWCSKIPDLITDLIEEGKKKVG